MVSRMMHRLLLPLALIGTVPAALAQDDFLQNREYNICMSQVITDPSQAFEMALGWQDTGGGNAARHCAAVALFELGHFPEAAERLEKLAGEMPDEAPPGVVADILGHAGIAWMEAGDNTRAYAAQSAALKLSPKNPAILTDRAMVLADSGKMWEAIDDLNEAIDVSPGHADILVLRGSAYRQLESYDLALEDLDLALKLDPDNPEGLLERGIIYRLTGKIMAARVDWLRLAERHEGRPAAEAARRNLELLDFNPSEK